MFVFLNCGYMSLKCITSHAYPSGECCMALNREYRLGLAALLMWGGILHLGVVFFKLELYSSSGSCILQVEVAHFT